MLQTLCSALGVLGSCRESRLVILLLQESCANRVDEVFNNKQIEVRPAAFGVDIKNHCTDETIGNYSSKVAYSIPECKAQSIQAKMVTAGGRQSTSLNIRGRGV